MAHRRYGRRDNFARRRFVHLRYRAGRRCWRRLGACTSAAQHAMIDCTSGRFRFLRDRSVDLAQALSQTCHLH